MRTIYLFCLPLLATVGLPDLSGLRRCGPNASASGQTAARADTFTIRSAHPGREVPFVLHGSGDMMVLFDNGHSQSVGEDAVTLRGTTPARIVIRDGGSETRIGALAEGDRIEIELPPSPVHDGRASVGGSRVTIVRDASGHTVISSGQGSDS